MFIGKAVMSDRKKIKTIELRTDNGLVIKGTELVFPILAIESDLKRRLIGSAFFILTPGIFVTAKHVLYSDTKKLRLTHGLTTIQFLPTGQVFERPIKYIWPHPTADVALGQLAEDTQSKVDYKNKILGITKRIPKNSEQICTLAYPETKVGRYEYSREFVKQNGQKLDKPIKIQKIEFKASLYFGKILGYFPDGFSLLKEPCYETSIKIISGASGGPVFTLSDNGAPGAVFAVNCTGWENHALSGVSSIHNILDMKLPSVTLDNKPALRNITVEESIIVAGGNLI